MPHFSSNDEKFVVLGYIVQAYCDSGNYELMLHYSLEQMELAKFCHDNYMRSEASLNLSKVRFICFIPLMCLVLGGVSASRISKSNKVRYFRIYIPSFLRFPLNKVLLKKVFDYQALNQEVRDMRI